MKFHVYVTPFFRALRERLLFPFRWRIHKFKGQESFRVYFFNGARTRRLNYDSAEEMFEVLRGDALRVSFEPEGEVSPLCPARPSSLILDRCREFEEISRATEAFITESQPSLAARPDLQRKASALLTKIDEARRISLPLLDR